MRNTSWITIILSIVFIVIMLGTSACFEQKPTQVPIWQRAPKLSEEQQTERELSKKEWREMNARKRGITDIVITPTKEEAWNDKLDSDAERRARVVSNQKQWNE